MKKTFITFGQDHIHKVGGIIFDKDCVAIINHDDDVSGRDLAFKIFGTKFCFEYPEEYWNDDRMFRYPRGYIEVPGYESGQR